jgi:hypothetical protein
MDVPDYSAFARQFLSTRLKRFDGDFEKTRAHSFEQLNALANALREEKNDPRVGLLEKKGGARVRDRASDIIAYDLGNGTCQLLDVIGDSEGEDGVPRAGWGLVAESEAGKRAISEWKLPFGAVQPTHAYDGGENDTGTCDICGKPRADAVHTQTVPGPGLDDLKQKVARLEALVEELRASCIRYGGKVALRTDNDHLVCAQDGGGGKIHSERKFPGEMKSWETFRLENPKAGG